jgi:hypothetical protein
MEGPFKAGISMLLLLYIYSTIYTGWTACTVLCAGHTPCGPAQHTTARMVVQVLGGARTSCTASKGLSVAANEGWQLRRCVPQERRRIVEAEEALARRRKIISELALRTKAVALQVHHAGQHQVACWRHWSLCTNDMPFSVC